MLAKRLHCTSQLFARATACPIVAVARDGCLRAGRRESFETSRQIRIGYLVSFLLGGHLEERIDSGLDRPFMQEVTAKGMDRADTSELQRLEGSVQESAFPASPSTGLFRFRCADEVSFRRPPVQ